MNEINVNKVIGETANEIWLRTGQVTFVFGVLSYVGFNGLAGFDFSSTTAFGPFVLMSGGVCMMLYGTKLREKKRIAERKHELEKRDSGRLKSEPTEGDECFWEIFTAKSPMTRAEVQAIEVPHDRKKTKDSLCGTINFLRFTGYSGRGLSNQN